MRTMRALRFILVIGLSVAPLAAQTDIEQAMTPNSYATGKLAALRDIYLISAPRDADTTEATTAHRKNREHFLLTGYESILRTFREQHDALAARYNSEVAQTLAAGRVPDPASFIGQLDALVYSTMNQIRLTAPSDSDPAKEAARQADESECGKAPCPGIGYILMAGGDLKPGESLWSDDRTFRLILQVDGALVLLGPTGPVWSSGVQSQSPAFVEMRPDGNLAMYDASGTELWASGTSAYPSMLEVTNDGTAIILDGFGRTLWTNGTLTVPQPHHLPPYLLANDSGFTTLVVTYLQPPTCSGAPGCRNNLSPSDFAGSQSIQISGIRTLTNNYCQEHLFECATVAITPQFDNRLASEGHVASEWHEGNLGGIYNYVNEHSTIATDTGTIVFGPFGQQISFPPQITFGFHEKMAEDPAHARARTGRGFTPAELRTMISKKKASACFAVTYPPGAEVYVDGLKVGATPLGFTLIRHDIERVVTVQLVGYKTVEKGLMPDGGTVSIGLTLEKNNLHSQPK